MRIRISLYYLLAWALLFVACTSNLALAQTTGVNTTSAALPLNLGVGGTTYMTIGSNPIGYVGIGVASPSNALVVGNDIGATSGPSYSIVAGNTIGNSYIEVGQASSNRGRMMWTYNATPANAYLALGTPTGANPLVLQDQGGNVGIGTTGPLSPLSVVGGLAVGAYAGGGTAAAAPPNGLIVSGSVGIG